MFTCRTSRPSHLYASMALGMLLAMATPGFCQDAAPPLADTTQSEGDERENARAALLEKGMSLINAHQASEAIAESFDPLIADYEAQYAGSEKQVYSARTVPETLLYMATAASAKRDAIALGPTWAYAYFLKAYALVELGRAPEARPLLEKAIQLSPQNPQFLAELGHSYIADRNWPLMLEIYERSEQATGIGSPEDGKTLELARALRGQGYALVEMGRLKEAEAMYKRCLKLDRNDVKAANELEYVRSLQSRL